MVVTFKLRPVSRAWSLRVYLWSFLISWSWDYDIIYHKYFGIFRDAPPKWHYRCNRWWISFASVTNTPQNSMVIKKIHWCLLFTLHVGTSEQCVMAFLNTSSHSRMSVKVSALIWVCPSYSTGKREEGSWKLVMGNVVSAHISTLVSKPRESDSDMSFIYRQRQVNECER